MVEFFDEAVAATLLAEPQGFLVGYKPFEWDYYCAPRESGRTRYDVRPLRQTPVRGNKTVKRGSKVIEINDRPPRETR